MLNIKIIQPESIALVGGSEDIGKPGGKILKNLKDGKFTGSLYVVNPRSVNGKIQDLPAFSSIEELPEPIDLAILSIPAPACPDIVAALIKQKKTKAFIIISAGFGEVNEEGKQVERKLADMVTKTGATLIGPNCIGVVTRYYSGIFTEPVPEYRPLGCDLISASGAMSVFLLEEGLSRGLPFSNIFSVGNSAQTDIEDVLGFLDENYSEGKDGLVKLLYFESIKDSSRLIRHAKSLVRKGCKIIALKSGRSEEGKKAALSHTGAISSSDIVVDAIFKKASITRAYSRQEMIALASVMLNRQPSGNKTAVITHAGGPAVILTDGLSESGFTFPHENTSVFKDIIPKLHPGASVINPFDILATGNAEQIGLIIDHCIKSNQYDLIIIILGSPGLSDETSMYRTIAERIRISEKPIFLVIPSIINVKKEISFVIDQGIVFYNDESVLASALEKVYGKKAFKSIPADLPIVLPENSGVQYGSIPEGLLKYDTGKQVLLKAGFKFTDEKIIHSRKELERVSDEIGFPLALKGLGHVHKSDTGSVIINIYNKKELFLSYDKIRVSDPSGNYLVQKMLKGTELFLGIKNEKPYGHLMLFGLGGVFVELLKDIQYSLLPLSAHEAFQMIHSIKMYDRIRGVRGNVPVNEVQLISLLLQLSQLVSAVPQIEEMDINPLMFCQNQFFVIDHRISIRY